MTRGARAEADRAQRSAADPHFSVFVTANAGSGKTKVLVDRIARLLLQGSRPSAFLCITYTKAAAAEMQRRLFERLGGWCVADDAALARDLAKLGVETPDLARARALFAQALETPGGLRIQTIHGFCERLLARFPIEAGVAPGFDVADEARAKLLLARARAEAALAEDAPREAFARFAAKLHGDALEALLDRLALRRNDFRAFAQRWGGELFAVQRLRHRHGATESAQSYADEFVQAIDWRALHEAADLLAGGSKQDQDCAQRLRTALARRGGAHAPFFAACSDFAFTSAGELRARLATAKLSQEHGWLEPLLSRFADACAAARARLNAIERAEDAAAALALALKLDQAYEEAKARVGALDFDDLIESAHALLRRSETAAWVLYKLDGGVDHILIDEGQDTSPAQWELIAPLRQEFFAGAGARERVRTVFAVGDPKQSIFGFQGADPQRFLLEAQTLSAGAAAARQGFKAPELRTSFRSAQQVLDVVDEVFAAKPLIAGMGGDDVIAHLAARDGEGGAVEVWPLTPRPAAAAARPWDAPVDSEIGSTAPAVLAREIAKSAARMIATQEAVWEGGKMRPMRAGDVLALVRTRGPLFRELIKAFKRAGLPVAGADRMVLSEELAVEDCLALMRVALDPADDLSLACVLKGPWCDLDDDDADLFPLAYGRGQGETLHARLMANADAKYAQARALVAQLCTRRGADAFEFLAWALESSHGGGASGWSRVFARLGPEARDPLEELLQRALKPSAHAARTLQRFLHEIEADAGPVKRELEAQADAVRVMTVHGAKGLEAPLVFLPDAAGEAADAPDNGLLFDDDEGPFVSFRSKDDDQAVAAARARHKERMLKEHWRLLYVAMTRARDRLIVCGAHYGNSKAGEAPESWRLAVHEALARRNAASCETPFGPGLRHGGVLTAPAAASAAPVAAAAPEWVRAPAPNVASPNAAAPSRLAHRGGTILAPRRNMLARFQRGRLIHALLERLPEIAPRQRARAARDWLRRRGVEEGPADMLAHEALAVIEAPAFAPVFGPSSRAEAAIAGVVAGRPVRGVVDRLVVEDARVIVLDYKSDRPAPADIRDAPEAYLMQLSLYREVLRQIFPNKQVTCALLWTEAPLLAEAAPALLDVALEAFARG